MHCSALPIAINGDIGLACNARCTWPDLLEIVQMANHASAVGMCRWDMNDDAVAPTGAWRGAADLDGSSFMVVSCNWAPARAAKAQAPQNPAATPTSRPPIIDACIATLHLTARQAIRRGVQHLLTMR